ncbi:phosphoadenosine phosphosulfate reductase family protein [Sphingomonas dokdonensis]|uniref:Phosphoadenosine phosphosulfate reductase family protein n=1 Tax=Sphingomonas dokdonensis TaxID=344880 RepID=A0A245ZCX7_9SPHN|nr:phosphoadenosine phosphosulfate reductase family protein [Sphingomonas dokdonensis]OWK27547.1 phosphoadenosine phosphosulfate reductase family protein [Sphingomonas dokdonensis]
MSLRGQMDLFASGFSQLAIDERVSAAIAAGAPVAFSLSGGKDSVSIAHATAKRLDALGHPRDRRVSIHSDLGRIEWRSTPATVEQAAAAIGTPLVIVRRKAGDLVDRWERRFELGLERYEQLLTYHLTSPWSSANNRFCTAELKTQVILPHLLRMFPGQQIVSVVGIRREESLKRRLAPVSKIEGKPYVRANGGGILTWHPGVEIREDEVYTYIAREGLPLAEAYPLGSTRFGCAFCVLASENDLTVAAHAPGNLGVLHHLVGMEARSSFSFQPQRWLGDVAPQLLPKTLLNALHHGKAAAAERRALEARLPSNLKYVKGWPQRVPSLAEASVILSTRTALLTAHGRRSPYDTPARVRDRIAELHTVERAREAA